MARAYTGKGEKVSWGIIPSLGRPLVVLLLLQLMGGMVLSPHRTFFPLYIKGLGYPVLLISALATGQQIMGLIGAWVGGGLADSLGRKGTLFLGQIGALLGSLAFLAPSVGWIAPLWLLGGLCGGLHTVAAQSYLLDSTPANTLGMFSALYNWGTTLGGALGNPVAGFLLEHQDYPTFGVVLGLLALLALATNLFFLPPSPVARDGKAASRRRLFGYGDIAARPTALILALLRFLPTVYWGMALILIPLMLHAAGAGNATIALYATVSQVLASVGQIIAGRAADRLGCKGVTVAAFSVLVFSILGIGALPDPLWSVFAFGVLGTTAAWSLSTLMPSLVAQVTEAEARGRALGWIHLWWNLGMVAGSLVGGVTFRWGPGLPFFIAGALNLGAIALVFVFFRMVTATGVPQPSAK